MNWTCLICLAAVLTIGVIADSAFAQRQTISGSGRGAGGGEQQRESREANDTAPRGQRGGGEQRESREANDTAPRGQRGGGQREAGPRGGDGRGASTRGGDTRGEQPAPGAAGAGRLEHPRLVFRAADVEKIRAKAGTPEGKAILAALDAAMQVEPDGITIGSYAAGHALRFALTGDQAHADSSRRIVEKTIAGVPYRNSPPLWAADYRMIFRTKAAVDVALAYDLCYQAWPEDFRRHVAAELEKRAREFVRGGGQEFNNRPRSNWVGNTKAAGGFLALAINGDPGTTGNLDRLVADARRGFFDYLQNAYGDRGWCAEGVNYMRYPMTTSGFQFLQALTMAEGRDVVAGTPAELLAPMYMAHLVHHPDHPYVPFFGLNYPFTGKDVSGFEQMYERTRWRSGDLVMALGSTSAKYRPAMLWTINQIVGQNGDATYDIYKPADAIYALANLALITAEPANPATVLPKAIEDQRFGYYLFRNRWQDQNDFVAAFYINADPQTATYTFQDAGSFRIYGLGARWADQRSRKDFKWQVGISRELENVVHIPKTNGWPGGKRLTSELFDDGGGIVTADISGAYSAGERLADARDGGIRAIRSFAVDYSGRCGAPALFIVADHITGDKETIWVMHTAAKPTVTGNVFTLAGPDGATLQGTVASPANAKIGVQEGEETHTITIPGEGEFLIVMTVQRNQKPPAVTAEGTGLAIQVRVGKVDVSLGGGKLVLSR